MHNGLRILRSFPDDAALAWLVWASPGLAARAAARARDDEGLYYRAALDALLADVATRAGER